jgi:hypothetical protein
MPMTPPTPIATTSSRRRDTKSAILENPISLKNNNVTSTVITGRKSISATTDRHQVVEELGHTVGKITLEDDEGKPITTYVQLKN